MTARRDTAAATAGPAGLVIAHPYDAAVTAQILASHPRVAAIGESGAFGRAVARLGSGGTLKIEGSNDGANWSVLTDPQGNDLSFTASKIETVSEITRYIRPNVTAGDGTTALTVSLFGRL